MNQECNDAGLKLLKKGENIMMCSFSELDSKKLETIKSMEQTMGKTLLAYACHDIKPVDLTEKELSQMQELEKKLGVVLVAVKA